MENGRLKNEVLQVSKASNRGSLTLAIDNGKWTTR